MAELFFEHIQRSAEGIGGPHFQLPRVVLRVEDRRFMDMEWEVPYQAFGDCVSAEADEEGS